MDLYTMTMTIPPLKMQVVRTVSSLKGVPSRLRFMIAHVLPLRRLQLELLTNNQEIVNPNNPTVTQ